MSDQEPALKDNAKEPEHEALKDNAKEPEHEALKDNAKEPEAKPPQKTERRKKKAKRAPKKGGLTCEY